MFSSSCPICTLGILVAVALAGIALGSIVQDFVTRTQDAGQLARATADAARQKTVPRLQTIDRMLAPIEEARDKQLSDSAWHDKLSTLLSERRNADPEVLGILLVGDRGDIIANSLISRPFTAQPLADACRQTDLPDAGVATVRPARATQPGGGVPPAPVLCFARRVRMGDAQALLVAVTRLDLFFNLYSDLIPRPHGSITLRDEANQVLLIAAATRPPAGTADHAFEPERDNDLVAMLCGRSEDSRLCRIPPERSRIDAPIAVSLEVIVAGEDVLAAWLARTTLIASSALIVLGFIVLSIVAVRRSEQREARRLELVGEVAADLRGVAERDRLDQLLAEAIPDLVPADVSTDAGGDRRLSLAVLGNDRVRIGALLLRCISGGSFSNGDLAALRLLARIADNELVHAATLGDAVRGAARERAAADLARRQAETVQIETSDAIFSLDPDWRFVSSNRNADRLFGEYAEDLRGRTVWDVFPELVGSTFETECRRAAGAGHAAEFEMQWLRTETWLQVRAFPRPPGLVVYLQDISRQITADNKLREVAKMDAIGRLTGGIAHDFNNLLTVILGGLENLELEPPDSAEIPEIHAQIKRAATTAAELTKQLLAFARRQPLSPVNIDIARHVVSLEGLLRNRLGPSITLSVRTPPNLWQARVDPAQLDNAIINLAVNASDAMPNGGQLVIDTANLTVRKPDIDQFGEIRPGSYVVISVSDTGAGIPKDIVGKVFEPFFTTKPSGRGTGLGLSMVYGFATQSGGHARINSEVGRGTVVRLYLPSTGEARRDAGSTAGGAREAEARLPGGRETILVVEDSEMVRDFARSVLVSLGYTVSLAQDGRAALTLVDQGLRPDLLLTDIILPNGMDGFAVAEQVGQKVPGIPVLYMSGYIDNIDSHQAKLDVQTNLLMKPFRRASLATMVRSRLDPARPGAPAR
jgi:PAS domain S-box-containing protein